MRKYVQTYQKVRVWAMILVIIGHCTTLALTISNNNSINPYAECAQGVQTAMELVRKLIYSFHMPLFVMLSGAVFALNGNRYMPKPYIKNRLKKLLIPYLAVGILFVIPTRMIVGYYSESVNIFYVICRDILLSYDPNYLWFVLMLFEVSALAIVFKKYILSDDKRIQYSLFLLFLLISVGSNVLERVPLQLQSTLQYLFWFYAGIIFEKKRNKGKTNPSAAIIAVLWLIWLLSFCAYTYLEKIVSEPIEGILIAKAIKMAMNYLASGSGCLAVLASAMRLNSRHQKVEKFLAQKSFSIYLFHCPIIWLLKYAIFAIIRSETMNSILYLIILIILMISGILLSLTISNILTRIWFAIRQRYLCKI